MDDGSVSGYRPADLAWAVQLALTAVKQSPQEWTFRNTLGVAYYRTGDWRAAIAALDRSIDLNSGDSLGPEAVNAFFLAMAHWRLKEPEQARRWYRIGVLWMEKLESNPRQEELCRFRAEAAGLLGLPEHSLDDIDLEKARLLEYWQLVLDAKPGSTWVYIARGNWFAERGQWAKAAADYGEALRRGPDQIPVAYRHALLCLGKQDADGYRKGCTALLDRFGSSSSPEAIDLIPWTCALGTNAVTNLTPPLRLAEKAVAINPKKHAALNMLGALLYRAGRWQEAARRLTEADAAPNSAQQEHSSAYNWYFQAMVHYRLGQVEEARRWLDKAVRETDLVLGKSRDEVGSPSEGSGTQVPWNRKLTQQLLRREAEALIESRPNK